MKWLLTLAATAILVVGIATVLTTASTETPKAEAGWFSNWFKTKTPTPTPTATPAPPPGSTSPFAPPECAGMLFNNVVIFPVDGGPTGGTYGTSGNDLIIVTGGTIYGRAGDDCILFTNTEGNGMAYGNEGNDVIITRMIGGTNGIVYGDTNNNGTNNLPAPPGYDRCIGNWQILFGCEATN